MRGLQQWVKKDVSLIEKIEKIENHITISRLRLDPVKACIRLLRPKQWIKNFFVLAPLLFSARFTQFTAVHQAILAMLLFCLVSSCIYILNDVCDIESDRLHPHKSKTRPLAAGIISIPLAWVLLAGFSALLMVGCLIIPVVTPVILLYTVCNITYIFLLKHQAIVDILTIAFGFVLRVCAGAIAIKAPISYWMLMTTLCLALFLAAIKRRQEFLQNGAEARQVLRQYSLVFLNDVIQFSGMAAVFCYGLFVMIANIQLWVTLPLVLFGLLRYWQVVKELNLGESPTDVLLADRRLLLILILWVIASGVVLWPKN